MLLRTIRFFTSAEVGQHLGCTAREAERRLRAVGAVPKTYTNLPHWMEDDVQAVKARFGHQPTDSDSDFSLTTSEAARRLGITVKLFERTITRGLRHEIERIKQGRDWRYSESSVRQYLVKRNTVIEQGLWRSSDIARHYGIKGQQALRWVREDQEHFPPPVVTVAGVDYWEPKAVKAYKKDLDAFMALPGISALADKVGRSDTQIGLWIHSGKLPSPTKRLNVLRFERPAFREAVRLGKVLSKNSARRAR